jgi:hypothetical protein
MEGAELRVPGYSVLTVFHPGVRVGRVRRRESVQVAGAQDPPAPGPLFLPGLELLDFPP